MNGHSEKVEASESDTVVTTETITVEQQNGLSYSPLVQKKVVTTKKTKKRKSKGATLASSTSIETELVNGIDSSVHGDVLTESVTTTETIETTVETETTQENKTDQLDAGMYLPFFFLLCSGHCLSQSYLS